MLIACEAVDRRGSVCAWDGSVRAWQPCPGEAEAHLVPLLDRYMRDWSPVSALAVAVGPGSFTGLRVSVLAVRTLAWLESLPVHPVDSLAACAVAQGEGTWAVLLPLKRDTTLRAVVRVTAGGYQFLLPTEATRDDEDPTWPPLTGAIAIGPALSAKPALVARWLPGVPTGSSAGPDARGVAQAAAGVAPQPWERILPAYHQEPAPVLQRARRRSPDGVA